MPFNFFHTTPETTYLILRFAVGIIILPYGLQKMFGWFPPLGGGIGVKGTITDFKKKKLPAFTAWLVMIVQVFGSIGLILGFLGRFAAFGNFIVFFAAILFHASNGWTMNWTGNKQGEGIEYHVLLLLVLLTIMLRGSGLWSIDLWLDHHMQ